MRIWPVEDSFLDIVPKRGRAESFWEDRGERYHAGIDVFALVNSPVLASEKGFFHSIRSFTSPIIHPFWCNTLPIIIRTDSGVYHH